MKRKFADRPNWKRVLSKKIIMDKLDNDTFKGCAILIYIEKVREALLVDIGGRRQCVADDGYSWLTLFPQNKSYVLTAMFNNQNEIVQWYIDICKGHGFTDKGIPWYDDLYLDIIISSDYKAFLIDEDDLALALKQKVIKREDFDFAYEVANKLLKQLEQNDVTLLKYSEEIYEILKKRLLNHK